jgi:hypothetical protein
MRRALGQCKHSSSLHLCAPLALPLTLAFTRKFSVATSKGPKILGGVRTSDGVVRVVSGGSANMDRSRADSRDNTAVSVGGSATRERTRGSRISKGRGNDNSLVGVGGGGVVRLKAHKDGSYRAGSPLVMDGHVV